jgi:hypothetical protein
MKLRNSLVKWLLGGVLCAVGCNAVTAQTYLFDTTAGETATLTSSYLTGPSNQKVNSQTNSTSIAVEFTTGADPVTLSDFIWGSSGSGNLPVTVSLYQVSGGTIPTPSSTPLASFTTTPNISSLNYYDIPLSTHGAFASLTLTPSTQYALELSPGNFTTLGQTHMNYDSGASTTTATGWTFSGLHQGHKNGSGAWSSFGSATTGPAVALTGFVVVPEPPETASATASAILFIAALFRGRLRPLGVGARSAPTAAAV